MAESGRLDGEAHVEVGSGSAVVALPGVMIAALGNNARTMLRRARLWGMDEVGAA